MLLKKNDSLGVVILENQVSDKRRRRKLKKEVEDEKRGNRKRGKRAILAAGRNGERTRSKIENVVEPEK